jgi:hypothetical protein
MASEVPVVRSIVAVAAGFFASNVMSAGADLAFRRLSPDSFHADKSPAGDGTLFVMMGYEVLFAAVAGYVTARLAIRKPLVHALVMALIVLVGRGFTATLSWNTVPAWFHLGVLALIVPAALLGAKIGDLRARVTG